MGWVRVDAVCQDWVKMPAQFEHLFVDTNGVRLHVVLSGVPSGKPVLLLHGFPEFWGGWRHQVPALVDAGFRVIVPDQRGYNLSQHPFGVRPYRLDELGKDMLGLMDHLKIEKVDLVGHDWGAAVAWWMAIHFPARIDHLAILNVPHPSVMLATLRKSLRQMLKSWYILFFQIPALPEWFMHRKNFSAAVHLLRSSGKASTFTPQDLEDYRRAWTNSDGLTGMINWYRALVRYQLPDAADIRVHVPTLVLWGKKDVALGSEMAEKSVRLCDNGRLLFFEDATHWVQHDAAAEVNCELISFFNELSGNSQPT
jgi:pimeloyl-ACP methyl ester carboxylesterase